MHIVQTVCNVSKCGNELRGRLQIRSNGVLVVRSVEKLQQSYYLLWAVVNVNAIGNDCSNLVVYKLLVKYSFTQEHLDVACKRSLSLNLLLHLAT